jgi:hypothetical protein
MEAAALHRSPDPKLEKRDYGEIDCNFFLRLRVSPNLHGLIRGLVHLGGIEPLVCAVKEHCPSR